MFRKLVSLCALFSLLCAFFPTLAFAQNFQLNASFSANPPATPLSVGNSVTLTITVTNAAASSAGGSGQAQVFIPSVFNFVSASCTQSQAQAPSGGTFEFDWTSIPDAGGQLAPGQSDHCDIQLTLASMPPGNVSATANIPPTTFDPTPGNASYQFNINFPPPTFSPALHATVSGQTVTLAFGASNADSCMGSSVLASPGWDHVTVCNSAASCGNVSVQLTNVPAGNNDYTVVCTNAGGSNSSDAGVVTVVAAPTFPQPLTATVNAQTVTLAFDAAGADSCVGSSTPALAGWNGVTVCNSTGTCSAVSVALSSVGAGPYSFTTTCTNASGNTSSGPASANVGGATPSTDLTVQATATPSAVAVGQTFAFRFTAQNLGAQDAPGTLVAVTTPAQVQILSSTCGLAVGSGAGTWNVGTLTANSSTTCDVQAKLLTTAASVDELLTISFAGTDTNSLNDSTSAHLTIGTGSDLSVVLSIPDITHQYTVGETVAISLIVTDAATAGDATAVIATFNVANPSALVGLASDVCGAPAAGQLSWNIGNLAHGATRTCKLTGVVASASTAIAVSANVAPTQTDISLGNNTSNLVLQTFLPPVAESTTVSGAPTTENSTHVALSNDGATAVFESQESDLVQTNANTTGQDIYTKVSGGKPVLETLDSQGHQLIGTSSLPAISGDGGIVAFGYTSTIAKQAKDIFTGNIWGGSTGQPKHQLDVGAGGATPNAAASGAPSVASAGGAKKLVFCSAASNLVAGDTNGANDVFLVDPTNPAQAAQLISTDASGKQLPGDSCEPKLSADGTKVVFTLSAPTLYNNNAFRQVVRKDLTTGALDLISLSTSPGGPAANADSSEPSINADGSVIAFTSKASNMDGLGLPVGGMEAFVSLAQTSADGAPRILKRVRSGDGTVPNGSSQHPQLTNDGTTLVMQTAATNFFGAAKALTSAGCGAVAITTNFFAPASLGSSLCTGSTSNQNPTISGNGTTTGFDSNSPQSGTSSSNSNAYSQGIGTSSTVVSNLSGDFSGQWYDPNQNGQGLVIDVTNPDASNNRTMILTWFVYLNGQSSWVQGVGTPHAGTGTQAGMVVVSMNPVGISQGKSFPLGEARATTVAWGSITLTFVDANTGTMTWTSSYPGFNSGTMPITHFLPVSLPAQDTASAKIKACYSGNWYNANEIGHGFEFEVLSVPSPLLAVDWFTYDPTGNPVWIQGVGAINGNSAQVPMQQITGAGAQFPPKYNPSQITPHSWGTATFTFTNSGSASVTWNSTITGYGAGTRSLQPLAPGLMDRRGCQ